MNTYEALRREIEIRLIRETVYKAINALNTKQSLDEDIKENDKTIKRIGEFLLTDQEGKSWEEYYQAI